MADQRLQSIEFIRNAFVLVPDRTEREVKTTLIPSSDSKKKHRIFCSCSPGKTPACTHAKRLVALFDDYASAIGNRNIDGCFRASPILQILGGINRVRTCPMDQLTIDGVAGEQAPVEIRYGTEVVLSYLMPGHARQRFIDRIRPGISYGRAWSMERALSLVETDHEKTMREMGHHTIGQLEERGLWNRLAYHCFREFGADEFRWTVTIDETDGRVRLSGFANAEEHFRITLPVGSEAGVFDALKRYRFCLRLWDDPAVERELMFQLSRADAGTLRCIPVIDPGDGNFVPVSAKLIYGNMFYAPGTKRLIQFSYASLQRIAAGWGGEKVVADGYLSGFLEQNLDALSIGHIGSRSDESIQEDLFGRQENDDLKRIIGRMLVTAFDRIELHPRKSERGRWSIAIVYRIGDHTVSLPSLLEAKQLKQRFCCTGNRIVDLASSAVAGALAQTRGVGADGTVELSNISLLLLRGSPAVLHFEGDARLTKKIKIMLEGKPKLDYTNPNGLDCCLREYQRNGVVWLLFLYDYYLGGLLCDEMGLGKTIQAIAFFMAVKEQRNADATLLVVCPTSVVSHWKRLIGRFAPALTVTDYTEQRQIPRSFDVVVSSYGIMRNDIETLERHFFETIVLDEAHQLKNRDTAISGAARRLRGKTVVGLTGTPIENHADDLLALFNIVLPGLSIDMPSEETVLQSVEGIPAPEALARFRKRIGPFILRRCKQTVLTELPPKVEEKWPCVLSMQQRIAYDTILRDRGGPLIETLRQEDATAPYMHIFALLSYLKQLCDSPALVSGDWRSYAQVESGKWEVFKELLDESIGSGQKVVVFTQFLDMVEIFRHYLESINVGYAVLTGKTKDRAAVVDRFTNDDACRVFVSSLLAGGVGIDLVAASVVIHYDRWWNASKENQATDRVHRIGQKNSVQVFKLISENTIEERIDRLIEQKTALTQAALTDDDPDAVKHFSRSELIELLSG